MKSVMEHGFPFPLTVSWVAYVFTWLFYIGIKATAPMQLASGHSLHEPKHVGRSLLSVIKSAASAASPLPNMRKIMQKHVLCPFLQMLL